MNEIIHEIEESLRQEKLHAMWKEYGPYLISGALLAILVTALSAGWQSYEYKVNTAHTAAIVKAVNSDDPAAGLDKIAATLPGSEKSVALLTQAGVLAQKGKTAEALAIYDKAAADKTLVEPFHSLAQLLDVRLQWSVQEDKNGKGGDEKTVDGHALIKRLQPLIDDRKNPWQNQARIQAALIAAHSLQDYDGARKFLKPLRDAGDTVPSGIQARAAALDLVYAAEGGKEPKS